MSANTYGRQVVVPLTNKSGGSVAAGDVVVVDTTTDESFTTTTSAANTSAIGVAAETIANNAVGRIIVEGYAPLVNVNASVTRNQFGTTHTVAKQAVASATRVAGTFCRWLKTSATPSAYIYPVDLAGAALTNPMGAVGDIIQGGTAGAPELLAAPLTGKVLTGAGVTTRVAYKYPPGYEIDYAEFTSNVAPLSSTHFTDASALLVVSGNSIAYDGSTIVLIEFFAPYVLPVHTDGGAVVFVLYDGASDIGRLGIVEQNGSTTTSVGAPARLSRRLTPSNASHTYSVKAFVSVGNGTIGAGAGGSGVYLPGYIRITKVSGGA